MEILVKKWQWITLKSIAITFFIVALISYKSRKNIEVINENLGNNNKILLCQITNLSYELNKIDSSRKQAEKEAKFLIEQFKKNQNEILNQKNNNLSDSSSQYIKSLFSKYYN